MTAHPLSRPRTLLLAPLVAGALLALAGCGSDKGAGVALDPNVKPQVPFTELSKEEKIERVKGLPMPDDAKQKRIANIEAGRE